MSSVSKKHEDAGEQDLMVTDKGISHAEMARYIMSRRTFKTLRDTNEVLVYRKTKGLYEFGGDKIIGALIEKKLLKYELSHQATRRYVDEVIGHIQRSTFVDREELNSNTRCINLNNGILDLKKMELWEHHPDLLSTVRIPVEFDPDAECPLIDNFFEEIVSEEQIPFLQEIFGWCLDIYSPMQRTILLIGKGVNGKSTFLNLLRTFLGPRNCTAIALQDLSTNRFATSRLFGKLANICADLPKTTMKDTSSLKKLTGSDAITAEEKFQKSFEFVNRAKLIFSANRAPIIEDDTMGLWRRMIVCEFPNEFIGENDNKRLLE